MCLIRLMLILPLTLFVSASYAQVQPLTSTESHILAWIDEHADETVHLIEQSVNINSGTQNTSGVRAVANILESELEAAGLTTQWMPQPEAMARAGHLFARTSGAKGKKLLLVGHMDTVFEPDDPFQRFERDGIWATGPGVSDMKSGNIIIVQALKALASVDALNDTQITVAFTGDEESPGKPIDVSRAALIKAGRWADVALEFEAGIRDSQGEWATVSRRGYNGWCLEVTGKQGHSSLIFNKKFGAGAIFEAARILHGFYETVRGEQYLTFNAGSIAGGTIIDTRCDDPNSVIFGKPNVIPNTVVVKGEIRTLSVDQTERVKLAMQAIVEQHLPQTKATLTFDSGYPAMAPTEGNLYLHSMLSEINQSLGYEAMSVLDPLRRGASDISFVAPYTDSLAGLGGYGDGSHSSSERLDLSSLPAAVKRAAILIYRLSR